MMKGQMLQRYPFGELLKSTPALPRRQMRADITGTLCGKYRGFYYFHQHVLPPHHRMEIANTTRKKQSYHKLSASYDLSS
jgi:hypothetical protein